MSKYVFNEQLFFTRELEGEPDVVNIYVRRLRPARVHMEIYKGDEAQFRFVLCAPCTMIVWQARLQPFPFLVCFQEDCPRAERFTMSFA
jgi:hypothetical protein